MKREAQPDELALLLAEQILQKIYGDDFKGCTVSLDQIAAIIAARIPRPELQTRELLELYEKVVEAIHLLSTPPDRTKVNDPDELRNLLSERLDAIHAVTTKTRQTTARAKANEP